MKLIEPIDERPNLGGNLNMIKDRVKGGYIKRTDRFSENEKIDNSEQALFLNANYNVVKKSVPGFTIHKPTIDKAKKPESQKKTKTKKKLTSKPKPKPEDLKASTIVKEMKQTISETHSILPKDESEVEKPILPESKLEAIEEGESGVLKLETSGITIREDPEPIKDAETKCYSSKKTRKSPDNVIDAFFEAKSTWKKNYDIWYAEHEKELTEISTMTSSTITKTKKSKSSSPKPKSKPILAEQNYNDKKFLQIDRERPKYSIPKAQRFLGRSASEENFGFLYPSLNLTKHNHPGPKISEKLPLTKQLIERQKENDTRELVKAIREYAKPIDTTECLIPKKNIPIITKPLIDQDDRLTDHQQDILRLHKVNKI